jgi:hypothetical protein
VALSAWVFVRSRKRKGKTTDHKEAVHTDRKSKTQITPTGRKPKEEEMAKKTTEAKTKFPAIYTAHCPSGPVDCCEKHAGDIRGLYSVLGCHIGFNPAPKGAECINCVNEHK